MDSVPARTEDIPAGGTPFAGFWGALVPVLGALAKQAALWIAVDFTVGKAMELTSASDPKAQETKDRADQKAKERANEINIPKDVILSVSPLASDNAMLATVRAFRDLGSKDSDAPGSGGFATWALKAVTKLKALWRLKNIKLASSPMGKLAKAIGIPTISMWALAGKAGRAMWDNKRMTAALVAIPMILMLAKAGRKERRGPKRVFVPSNDARKMLELIKACTDASLHEDLDSAYNNAMTELVKGAGVGAGSEAYITFVTAAVSMAIMAKDKGVATDEQKALVDFVDSAESKFDALAGETGVTAAKMTAPAVAYFASLEREDAQAQDFEAFEKDATAVNDKTIAAEKVIEDPGALDVSDITEEEAKVLATLPPIEETEPSKWRNLAIAAGLSTALAAALVAGVKYDKREEEDGGSQEDSGDGSFFPSDGSDTRITY
jgi:hypothetical protein